MIGQQERILFTVMIALPVFFFADRAWIERSWPNSNTRWYDVQLMIMVKAVLLDTVPNFSVVPCTMMSSVILDLTS